MSEFRRLPDKGELLCKQISAFVTIEDYLLLRADSARRGVSMGKMLRSDAERRLKRLRSADKRHKRAK